MIYILRNYSLAYSGHQTLYKFFALYIAYRLPCYFVCTREIEIGKYTIVLVRETQLNEK